MSEQLQLDIEAACARLLADRLAATKRTPQGAARLLAAIVEGGLDERALMSAAALCLVADSAASERLQPTAPNHQEDV